jgi:hypothetical protein
MLITKIRVQLLTFYSVLQNHCLSAVWAFAVTAGSGLYKISPKEAQGHRVFLTGPACPCGSLTLASQPNKLCFVDCIHTWLSVSRGNRIPVPNKPKRLVWWMSFSLKMPLHCTQHARKTVHPCKTLSYRGHTISKEKLQLANST